jgi:hypothetical protein
MIVSIHIPKTAGKSFRLRLEASYGARLLSDYDDWIGIDTPEVRAQRAEQAAKMRARRDEIAHNYDIIYGQFIVDKYVAQFPETEFTAFFREPCQRAVSHYEFLLRHSDLDHPLVRKFNETRPPLPELLKAVPNYQSIYVGKLAIEDFAMVGLAEQYERSVALFEAIFRRKLPPEAERANVNPNRNNDGYAIDPAVRHAIETYSAADVALYRRAQEVFAKLTARYGV